MTMTHLEAPLRKAALHRLFWRVHFWAGLVGAPIVLFAALTGLVYVFTPQIEARCHADLDRVAVGAAVRPLDQQVAAAQAAHPDEALRFVVPAHRPGDSTQVYLRAAHEHHAHAGRGEHDHGLPTGSIVYVNPHTGQVLGRLQEMQRFKTWARKLHANALQGNGWRWLLELGASWLLVLFATGLTLWWPRSRARGGPGWRALLPAPGRGRRRWRDLHATVAIVLGLVLSIVLVTGLTWARHSGHNFRLAQDALGQSAPKPGKDLRSTVIEGQAPIGWQRAHELASAVAPDVSIQLTPPDGPDGTWRAENFDRSQPTNRFTQVIDAYSGRLLFNSGWDQLPLLSQATAVGIPFHRGEFGLWNQLLLVLAALAVVFSVVSGFVMWWLRRPPGQWAVPRLVADDVRLAPRWVWPVAALLGWALPVFGWSLMVLTALEACRLLAMRRTAAAGGEGVLSPAAPPASGLRPPRRQPRRRWNDRHRAAGSGPR